MHHLVQVEWHQALAGRDGHAPHVRHGGLDAADALERLGGDAGETGERLREAAVAPAQGLVDASAHAADLAQIRPNEGEWIVDLVGDARRERAHRLELLGATHHLLVASVLGSIAQHRELPGGLPLAATYAGGVDVETASVRRAHLDVERPALRVEVVEATTQALALLVHGEGGEHIRQQMLAESLRVPTQQLQRCGIGVEHQPIGVGDDHPVAQVFDHVAPRERIALRDPVAQDRRRQDQKRHGEAQGSDQNGPAEAELHGDRDHGSDRRRAQQDRAPSLAAGPDGSDRRRVDRGAGDHAGAAPEREGPQQRARPAVEVRAGARRRHHHAVMALVGEQRDVRQERRSDQDGPRQGRLQPGPHPRVPRRHQEPEGRDPDDPEEHHPERGHLPGLAGREPAQSDPTAPEGQRDRQPEEQPLLLGLVPARDDPDRHGAGRCRDEGRRQDRAVHPVLFRRSSPPR